MKQYYIVASILLKSRMQAVFTHTTLYVPYVFDVAAIMLSMHGVLNSAEGFAL